MKIKKGNVNKLSLSDWVPAISVVIAFISMGLSFFTFLRGCSQESKIMDLSLRFRPILKIAAKPHISSFQLHSNPISIKQLQSDAVENDSISTAVNLPCTLSIRTKLRITNSGNSLAKLCAIIWTDTLSGSEKIRDILCKRKPGENTAFILSGSDYFDKKEILSGDTTDFEIEQTIQYEQDNSFTMHCVFLYEGENGVLYDTYYWAKYKANPIYIKPLFSEINGKPYLRLVYPKIYTMHELLVLQNENSSYKTYSKNEGNDILTFLKQNQH